MKIIIKDDFVEIPDNLIKFEYGNYTDEEIKKMINNGGVIFRNGEEVIKFLPSVEG
jgi:hypothetical protein